MIGWANAQSNSLDSQHSREELKIKGTFTGIEVHNWSILLYFVKKIYARSVYVAISSRVYILLAGAGVALTIDDDVVSYIDNFENTSTMTSAVTDYSPYIINTLSEVVALSAIKQRHEVNNQW